MTLDEQFEEYMEPDHEEEMEDETGNDPLSISMSDFHEVLDDHDIEHFDPHEDDALMFDILAPEQAEAESEKLELHESHVLSVPERLKLARRMRFMSHRMALLRKMKARRMAPTERLLYRSRKVALTALRKKVAGQMGQSYATLTPSQKVTVDTMVTHRYGNALRSIVDRAAQRLLPRVRKKELERVRKANTNVSEQSKHSAFDPRGTIPVDVGATDSTSGKFMGTYNDRNFDPVHNPDYDGSEYIVKPDTKDKVDPVDRSQLWPTSRTRHLMKIMNAIHEARQSKNDPSVDGDTGRNSVIDQLRRAVKNRGDHTEVIFDDGSKKKFSADEARRSLDAYSKMLQNIRDAGERQRAAGAFSASSKSHADFLNNKLPPKPSGGKAMRYRPVKEGILDLPGVSPSSLNLQGLFPSPINPRADFGPLGPQDGDPAGVTSDMQFNLTNDAEGDSPRTREIGTPSLVRQYANMTPGQNGNAPYTFATFSQKLPGFGTGDLDNGDCGKSVRQYQMIRDALKGYRSMNESFVAGIPDAPFARDLGMNATGGFSHHPSVEAQIQQTSMVPYAISEAEYQGRKVTLNKPSRTSDGKSKFQVHVMGPKGKPVKVRFGDPNMEIKRDDPERRSNFRARHNCDDPGPKTKARYWSCRQWRAGSKVEA